MLMHGIMQLSIRIENTILTDYYCFMNYCEGKTGKG